MKNIKQIALELVGIAALSAPMVGFAQYSNLSATPAISTLGQVSTAILVVVNWMIGLFWILAIAFVIWAAFLYLTAGGDEEKVKEAKGRIIYAIIAAAIALLATGIKAIAGNLLTGTV